MTDNTTEAPPTILDAGSGMDVFDNSRAITPMGLPGLTSRGVKRATIIPFPQARRFPSRHRAHEPLHHTAQFPTAANNVVIEVDFIAKRIKPRTQPAAAQTVSVADQVGKWVTLTVLVIRG